jgi:hypothetical protein
MNLASEYQPKPIRNERKPTWEMVIEEYRNEFRSEENYPYCEDVQNLFHERDVFGREKHGTPLQAFNGRGNLPDALQENMDLIVYLRNAYEESFDEKEKKNIWTSYYSAIIMFENLYMIYKQRELSAV